MRFKRLGVFIFIFSGMICLSARCSTIPDTSSCEYTLETKWVDQIPPVLDKLLEHSPFLTSVKIHLYAHNHDRRSFWVPQNSTEVIKINLCQNIDFQSIEEFAFVLAHEMAHIEDFANMKASKKIRGRTVPKSEGAVPMSKKILAAEKQTLQAAAKNIDIDAAKPYLLEKERHKETETYADLRGAILTHKAGFNPCSFISLIQRKKKDGSFRTEFKESELFFSPTKREFITTDYIHKKLEIQCV